MNIGNCFKKCDLLKNEGYDKREKCLIMNFISIFCFSFIFSILLSIFFNLLVGLFVGMGIFSIFLRLKRYDENLNNDDFRIILSNRVAKFVYNVYKFLVILCVIIIFLVLLDLH